INLAGRCTFVDGSIRGTVIRVVDDEDGILSAVPAGDRSVFRGEDEVSRFAGSNEKIRRATIENDARGSRLGSRRRAIRRRNGEVTSAINGNGAARESVVEGGRTGI